MLGLCRKVKYMTGMLILFLSNFILANCLKALIFFSKSTESYISQYIDHTFMIRGFSVGLSKGGALLPWYVRPAVASSFPGVSDHPPPQEGQQGSTVSTCDVHFQK